MKYPKAKGRNNLNKNLNFIDYYKKLRPYSLNYLLKLR